jgi:hypothetical protein
MDGRTDGCRDEQRKKKADLGTRIGKISALLLAAATRCNMRGESERKRGGGRKGENMRDKAKQPDLLPDSQ